MSTSTSVVNGVLIYILAFSALFFFLIVFFMIYFVIRYRKSRNPVPVEVRSSGILEVIWVLVPTLFALTMFLYGLTGFQFLRNAPADSILVKVHARQWSWLFEYGNGKKSPDLVAPLGKDVRCELTSDDVIHGFYVPAFRIQQDVVPGIKTQAWFNATTTGSYDILCSQYCGLKHSNMRALLIVVPPDQFNRWLKGENIQFPGKVQSANMPRGQMLLLERGCLSCHSLDGGIMTGPTFKGLIGSKVRVKTAGKKRIITADENYIKDSIINPGSDIVDGFPNIMSSGRNILSDEEIEEIIEYMKGLK